MKDIGVRLEGEKPISVSTCDMRLFPPSLTGTWEVLFVPRGSHVFLVVPLCGKRGSSCITVFLTRSCLLRSFAKLFCAWLQAKTQYEVKTAADAAAKAHGEAVTMLAMDWNSLMENFRQIYGPDLCENELPAQFYYEEFEECLAEGSLEAERLRDVVSEEEAQEQHRLKADPARQYRMHLDGKLTLQTRRKFTSSELANQEQLRAKYTVLQNMWLLAQLRQPGRSIFKDLTKSSSQSSQFQLPQGS